MNNFDPTEYGITIRRKPVEGHMYFVGTVTELPDIEVYEDSYQDAYNEVVNIIVDLKAVADKRGRQFPLPAEIKEEDFSGRVTLRLAKSMHKKAATHAEREGMSLNSFFVSIIAEAIGSKEAKVEMAVQNTQAPTPSTKVGFVVGDLKNFVSSRTSREVAVIAAHWRMAAVRGVNVVANDYFVHGGAHEDASQNPTSHSVSMVLQ